MTILFIEDNEATNYYHNVIIEDAAPEAKARFIQYPMQILADWKAGNGQPADYDVIVVDLHLPGYSGWQFLQEMRAFDLAHPIIYIQSTSMNPADFEKVNASSIVRDFLPKPLKKEHVLDIIKTIQLKRLE